MHRNFKYVLFVCITALAFITIQMGCKKQDKFPDQTLPDIIKVNPTSAIPGALVTIKGTHLNNVTAVRFGTIESVFNIESDTSISAIVPDSIAPGQLYVQVYVGDGVAYAAQKFTIVAAPKIPKITKVAPDTAFPGDNITITGINFSAVSSITFGGTSALYIIDDSTKLTVTVPAGLINTHQLITVSAPTGSDTSSFYINFAPVINSVDPNSGKPGDIITIRGVRFNNITAVKLGQTTITGNVVNDSTITFPVPSNSDNGFITVTNALGTATSPQSFVVIHPISLFIFNDAFLSGWAINSYSATTTISTDHVEDGTKSLATTYTAGYGAFRINGTASVDLSTYTTLRFSVYGGPGTDGKQISVAIDGDYNNPQKIIISEGKYTDYFIPLSSLGTHTTLNEIVLQEFSGNAPSDIYVDNIGLN